MSDFRSKAFDRGEATGSQIDVLQVWLDRLNAGDDSARERLIVVAEERLRILTHNMLRGDRIHRWEQTDDVMQEALLQLHRSLSSLRPASPRDFLRIAAFHIRRTILGMARHYYGPLGMGTHQPGATLPEPDAPGPTFDASTPSQVASRNEQWLRLQHAVASLPDDLQEVTELMWVHGLTAVDAARLLGLSDRTIRRRWQRARLQLADALADTSPCTVNRQGCNDVE